MDNNGGVTARPYYSNVPSNNALALKVRPHGNQANLNTITGLNVDLSEVDFATDKYAAIFLNGKVGIGTSAPKGDFHIKQTSNNPGYGLALERQGGTEAFHIDHVSVFDADRVMEKSMKKR